MDPKVNKVRSIQSSIPEPSFVPKNPSRSRSRNNKEIVKKDDDKVTVTRKTSEPKSRSTTTSRSTVSYTRRRGTTVTSSSTAAPVTQKQLDNTSRFKPTRKSTKETPPTISKSRRPFATRSSTLTPESVATTESSSLTPTKKTPPLNRGNFRASEKRQKVTNGDINDSSEEENYPEHFKLLLKNKTTNTTTSRVINEGEKKVLKKPAVKSFRPVPVTTSKSTTTTTTTGTTESQSARSRVTRSSTTVATKTEKKANNSIHFAQRPRVPLVKPRTVPPSTTEIPQSTTAANEAKTTNRFFRRPRPTERNRGTQGSTLQEPPTEKPTTTTPTRGARLSATNLESINTQTDIDLSKQIDPPIQEYFPRTSSVSLQSHFNS